MTIAHPRTAAQSPDPAGLFEGFGVSRTGPLFVLDADGQRYTSGSMIDAGGNVWRDGDLEVRLEASMTSDGSRAVVLEASGVQHVEEVCLLQAELAPAPDAVHDHAWLDIWGMQRSTVVFARYDGWSLFACYANPFQIARIDGADVRLSYRPSMDVHGTFRSDALVVGRAQHTGHHARFELLRGRDVVEEVTPGYADALSREDPPVVLDTGEVAAVRAAVTARVPWSPPRARVAHWDWGQNLFRLDPTERDTQAVYARMCELCAEIGVDEVLIAPGNPDLAGEVSEVESDAWTEDGGPWQQIMWLGLGGDVGRGDWNPGDALPDGVGEIVAAVRDAELGLVAYTNPQILWRGREDWAVQADVDWGDGEEYRWACLAVPEVREVAIDTYLRFIRDHDLSGVSLDFVFWLSCDADNHGHAPGRGSRYAQWDGYRRLLGALRDQLDGPWVEGLIGSQMLMPWGGRNMTHPHPDMGDNQPQWLPAWPDLSLDRTAANYQRRTAWWFRNLGFTPSYKVPGQVGHQANRTHYLPVERGWDWAGARFNLLSAIASGPSSLSLCFLPCWDADEWAGMRARDGRFFREWIDFARDNADVLADLEDLFEEPRPGAVDGTAATRHDGTGFVFLANPDYEEHVVDVPLDEGFLLRERHPQAGRLWSGTVTVEPHEVAVLEVVTDGDVEFPAVFGAAARVAVDPTEHAAGGSPSNEVPVPDDAVRVTGKLGAGLQIIGAVGMPGSERVVEIRLPTGETRAATLRFGSDGVAPTLGPWRDAGTDEHVVLGEVEGHVRLVTTWAPGRRLPALLEELTPPVSPRGLERRRPWADPSRLRLFPALLDPGSVDPRVYVDGDCVEVHQAYVGDLSEVKDDGETFLQINNLCGHYVDLTDRLRVADDLTRPWRIELELDLQWAGQLTGVHVADLPRRTTDEFEVITSTTDHEDRGIDLTHDVDD